MGPSDVSLDVRAAVSLSLKQLLTEMSCTEADRPELLSALKVLRLACSRTEATCKNFALDDFETWRLQSGILFPFYIAVVSDSLLHVRGLERNRELLFFADRKKACLDVRNLYLTFLTQLQVRLREGPLGAKSEELLLIREESLERLLSKCAGNLRSVKISFTRKMQKLREFIENSSREQFRTQNLNIDLEWYPLALPLLPSDVKEETEEEQRELVLEIIMLAAQWAQIRIHEFNREIAALDALARRAESVGDTSRCGDEHIPNQKSCGHREPSIMYIDSHCSRMRYFSNAAELRGYLQHEPIAAQSKDRKVPFGDCCLAHIHRDELEEQPIPKRKPSETDFNDTHGACDIRLEDQIALEKRRWDSFCDEHRRGEGNRYRKG